MTDDTKAGLHHRTWEAGAAAPLNGVRVLDLSRLFAGNVLSQQLGDFGADVIKVEPPTGDTLRDWRSAGVSAHWKVYSRNKRSLALDLRSPESKDVLLKLAATASVFMESFRPGVLEKMGLGPEVLLAANPKLIIVRISGWGQDGPYHRRPGFGTVIEGMSGFAAINGFEDREPVLPPMYLADGVAGLYGASAVLIALRAAEAALRSTVGHHGSAGRPVSPHRQAEAAHRQPVDQLGAAQRLPLQRRQVCRAFRLDPDDGRARAAHHRPTRAGR